MSQAISVDWQNFMVIVIIITIFLYYNCYACKLNKSESETQNNCQWMTVAILGRLKQNMCSLFSYVSHLQVHIPKSPCSPHVATMPHSMLWILTMRILWRLSLCFLWNIVIDTIWIIHQYFWLYICICIICTYIMLMKEKSQTALSLVWAISSVIMYMKI